MANSGSRIVGLEPIRNTACSQGAGDNFGFLPAPSSLLLALGALLFALCFSAPVGAQRPTKVPRIGFLIATSQSVSSARIADTRAAKKATSTIPIVMAFDDDPIGNGFAKSLARPGGERYEARQEGE